MMILRYILIFLFLFITLPTYSKESKFEKRLQKDLKKLSKFNGFIDNNLELYDEGTISDLKKSIVIIYNHGSYGQAKIDYCNKGAMNVPEVIRNLHNKKINDLTIKIYRLCSGVRGLKELDWDKVHNLEKVEGNANGFIEMSDHEGIQIYDKLKQTNKRKIMLDKVNELIGKGFTNIILAGHSCGAWASLYLTGRFPDKIKGSIALNPACGGEIDYRKEWPAWGALRNYEESILLQLSEINSLIFIHDKDPFENSETLSFLNNINKIQIINYTNFECKGKFGANAHYHPVYPKEDNCFAKWEAKNNYIINYLESIF